MFLLNFFQGVGGGGGVESEKPLKLDILFCGIVVG